MASTDEKYMHRALQLAAQGRGHVSPNPMVGCVIVKNDQIIGEGYHAQCGHAHAEVNAIQSCTESPEGATAYVTLEPCAHFGKTPPCADLLVEKKVSRVVVAMRDPFSEVDGKGIEKLKAAGIDLTVGILENEAKRLNARFVISVREKRPYIILKWAHTQDGFVARSNFDSKWISNRHSRQLVHKWRAEEDAILVGYNTTKYDNPSLTTRDWDGQNPVRVLIDSRNEIADGHLFDGSVKTLIFGSKADQSADSIEYLRLDSENEITSILGQLHKKRIQSLIVEGGSATLRKFIQTGLWDEARVFESSSYFGDGISAPTLNQSPDQIVDVMGDKLHIYENSKR